MAFSKNEEYMDLTLEEMKSGIDLIKGFIEDLRYSVMGYMVTSHPDYNNINNILNNFRLLVGVYQKDLDDDYGHTHTTSDWFDMTIKPSGK